MGKSKRNYVAWDIDHANFPKNGTLQEQIEFILRYGILAPSTHNSQPWKILRTENQVEISPDKTKQLPYGDPKNTGLYISLGAFAENVITAAKAYGLILSTEVENEKILLKFSKSRIKQTNKLDSTRLNDIKLRHSNKFPYKGEISKNKLHNLAKTKTYKNTEFIVINDRKTREGLMDLHIKAAKLSLKDKLFVKELSNWLRLNGTLKFTGMPGFVSGNNRIKSIVAKPIIRLTKKVPLTFIEQEKILLESSPAFAIFGTVSERPQNIIRTGMLIERFWLRATGEGLVAHPLFAMIKSDSYRKELKKMVGMKTEPIFFMRLGEPTADAPLTPRRQRLWN